ncbi:hypothetical protein C479_05138 [Halovivax asiaticus JCM 14624]|uniref:Zinc ribbon domain-containing protein n=1 Tax=Halovivax asiaticus JCM 14624 TaxID=1227490 RepID=M0BMS8_9EURY|nr:zinc ribbon domain-containing protein [Halovivax asiaticus]ELZ12165.1 hypothetical protein C479_05138 [Halovivax asiaticus JCM 14624]
MGHSISRKRPWLAAVLATLVTGLGHLYLRRWRRALGWLFVVFVTGALFVPPEAMEALVNEGAIDPVALAPSLLVGAFSVVDAYLVARALNMRNQAAAAVVNEDESTVSTCPNCGKELDPDLDFCQWCTTSIDDAER